MAPGHELQQVHLAALVAEHTVNRRNFLSSSAVGAAGAVLTGGGAERAFGQPAKSAAKPALMKLGATARGIDDDSLKALARFGVTHLVVNAPIAEQGRLYATVDELEKQREIVERNKLTIAVTTPPNLPSSHIDRDRNPAIMLGQSPQRDRDIEAMQSMIRNCAAAGIPCIKYNMSILGVLRTGRREGRADTSYSYFKLADAVADPPLTKAGVVGADAYWERITYFLERVIPVATEYKVMMACHPNDSMTPPEGYQGVHAVLSTVEGLKKFVSIQESPYHGLNFCQGTLAEMLQDPGKEIYDHIKYFADRKKIGMVHFRNIRGNRQEFAEVAVDEGVVDMARAMKVYRDSGYGGPILPDHSVQAPNDQGGEKYMAFVYGYISALIKAANLMA
jgi:mannonate dehydratase